MAPCGPVVSVTGELWDLWERSNEDVAALETLETRYRSLGVSLLGLDEERRGTLEPFQNRLFITCAPLAEDVYLGWERRAGQARATLTACKIDRNLQVGHLTTVRFARRSAPHNPVQRRLRGVNSHFLSVHLVNSGATPLAFSLLVRPVEAQF